MNYRELFRVNRKRYLYTSVAVNLILGIIKCLTAVSISSSLFAISGLYNFALCIGRSPYLHLNKQMQKRNSMVNQHGDRKSQLLMSIVIVVLGVLFTAFGGKMLYTGEVVHYSEYGVYAIALCAFVKLGVSIYWITKLKGKNHSLELIMTLTNFCDALVSIVLTQSALLVMKGIERASYYDGIFGVLVGIVDIIIGVICIFRSVKGNQEV